ncbi:MAG TPA: hypothetical protein VMV21_09565, partial [Vicinamibacteria bacterium]|nr:hypothetical protein [Vicinamibacteria bacterium]
MAPQRTEGRSRRAAPALGWASTLVLGGALLSRAALQEPAPLPLQGQDAETFLQTARVVLKEPLGTGITHSDRITLEDGTRKARAVWKT